MPANIQPASEHFDDNSQLDCRDFSRLDEIRTVILAFAQSLALLMAVAGLIFIVLVFVILAFMFPDKVSTVGMIVSGLASFIAINHKKILEAYQYLRNPKSAVTIDNKDLSIEAQDAKHQ